MYESVPVPCPAAGVPGWISVDLGYIRLSAREGRRSWTSVQSRCTSGQVHTLERSGREDGEGFFGLHGTMAYTPTGSGETSAVILNKPECFSLARTVRSHGWVNLAPYSWQQGVLATAFAVDGIAVDARITEASAGDLEVDLSVAGAVEAGWLESTCRPHIEYSLDLRFPAKTIASEFSAHGRQDLAGMVLEGWGRLLHGASPWEDAAKTLLTTNCSWCQTERMVHRLCSTLGPLSAGGRNAFPGPRHVADGAGMLHRLGLGYRAEYLLDLAMSVLEDGTWSVEFMCRDGSDEQVRATLESVRGFGSYAVNHMLVMLGRYTFLPVDREVMKYLGVERPRRGRLPTDVDAYREFGQWRFIAYKLDRIGRKENWLGGVQYS